MPRDRESLATEVDALIGMGGGEMRATPHSGARALMLAVLEDGIRTLLGADSTAQREAERWIFGSHPPSVFSFEMVCETLSLEPKPVRRALRRLQKSEVPPELLPRSRPNSRARTNRLSKRRKD